MLFPLPRILCFVLAAEEVLLIISNQLKCDPSVKLSVPDTFPTTCLPFIPTKEELLSHSQNSEDPIILVPIMLSITLYHNYIWNIYFPAMTLDKLLRHLSFLNCIMEIIQSIKRLECAEEFTLTHISVISNRLNLFCHFIDFFFSDNVPLKAIGLNR